MSTVMDKHEHLQARSDGELEALSLIPTDRVVFVFGSNLAGLHGGGAARHAADRFGAVRGEGLGWHGQSYAVPTMDLQLRPLPLEKIRLYVAAFLRTAESEPGFTFYVTALGTGIAGFTHEQVAPMFSGAPSNCLLPPEWAGITSTTGQNGVTR